jgi:hypothetical protein
MKYIFFLTLTILSQLSLAQWATLTIEENAEHTFESELVVFSGHSTQFWDRSRKTENATRALLRLGRTAGATNIATAAKHMMDDPAIVNWHYFINEPIDALVHSRAGQHDLKFPNLKHIFFLGGNMGRCLCEGIRDVVRGFTEVSTQDDVNLYIVKDGTYDSYPAFSPMRKDAVKDFVQKFYVPSFNCPLQNWNLKPRMHLKDWALKLYYGGEHLMTYDLEPKDTNALETLTHMINLHFIESREAERLLLEVSKRDVELTD